MKSAFIFTAVLLALPLTFLAVRVIDPVVPYAWRTSWRFLAVVAIPAVACGLAYVCSVGRPQPPSVRCPSCGTPAFDPSEPNCLECGRRLESGEG